jgi:hypothetical protein
MKAATKLFFAVLGCSWFITACEKPYYDELRTIQTWHLSYDDSLHALNSRFAKPFAGKGFSRINEAHQSGDDLIYYIPDSLIQKDIRICIDGYMRSGALKAQTSVAFSFEKGNVFYWNCFRLKELFSDTGVWVHWSDSTQVPAGINSVPGARVVIYGSLLGGRKYLDMDEINITLKEVTRVNKPQ